MHRCPRRGATSPRCSPCRGRRPRRRWPAGAAKPRRRTPRRGRGRGRGGRCDPAGRSKRGPSEAAERQLRGCWTGRSRNNSVAASSPTPVTAARSSARPRPRTTKPTPAPTRASRNRPRVTSWPRRSAVTRRTQSAREESTPTAAPAAQSPDPQTSRDTRGRAQRCLHRSRNSGRCRSSTSCRTEPRLPWTRCCPRGRRPRASSASPASH
mmetsp:Transcript_97597/g.281639  ORF Transcript_97597/g.281639 Transcript_97597/m.281639 type:complete len:210 (-) Transcript_97597:1172-1801(-)